VHRGIPSVANWREGLISQIAKPVRRKGKITKIGSSEDCRVADQVTIDILLRPKMQSH